MKNREKVKYIGKCFVKPFEKGSIVLNMEYNALFKGGDKAFSITAAIYDQDMRCTMSGGLRDEIIQYFPEFAHMLRFHLWPYDGPSGYIETTLRFVCEGREPDITYARMAAIWPDATLEQLRDKNELKNHLQELLAEFHKNLRQIEFIE